MALISQFRGDFSAGMYRGRKAPPNAVYDAINMLVNDEGLLFGRGGSAFYSSAGTGSRWLALRAAYMPAPEAERVLAWNSTAGPATLDGALAPVDVGVAAAQDRRPVMLGGYLLFPNDAIPGELGIYAGSLKSALYSTGTIGTTNGSTTVTGSGTTWTTNADPGKILQDLDNGFFGIVKSVTDNAHLELLEPWNGSTDSGLAYQMAIGVSIGNQAIALARRAPGNYVTAAGSGTPRLLMATGNRIYASDPGDALTVLLSADPNVFVDLPAGLNIIGAEGFGDSALLFTTQGVWRLDNLSLDPVDDSGNEQWVLTKVNGDAVLWGDPGIVSWGGGVLAPTSDDLVILGGDGSVSSLTGDGDNAKIRPLYRSYVQAGYRPGFAAVYGSHYMLPVLDGTTLVDVLACRLDRGAVWTRWTGLAAGPAYATLPATDSAAAKLLGLVDGARRVLDVTGAFAPTAANATDADGSTPARSVITNDFDTGGQQPGTVDRVRVRYVLVNGPPLDDGPVLDDFDRADGVLGSEWTADPFATGSAALQIIGHAAAGSGAGGLSEAYYNAKQFSPSTGRPVRLTIAARGNNDQSEIGFVQAPGAGGDGYAAVITYGSPDQVDIFRIDNGVFSDLPDGSQELAEQIAGGERVAFSVASDGTIAVAIDGVLITSVTDMTYFHAGQTAFAWQGIITGGGGVSDVRHDDFSLGFPAVSIAVSSDEDADVYTELTDRGEQGGAAGWGSSDGSKYQWAKAVKRQARLRVKITQAGSCASFVLRSVELLTRSSGKQ